MELLLSGDQTAILDQAQSFARSLRGATRDIESDGVGDFAATYTQLGFLQMDWPESADGFALGRRTKTLCMEALAFGDAAAALCLDRRSWVCSPLLHCAPVAERVAAALAEPHWSPTFFVDEDQRIDQQGGALHGKIPYLPTGCCDTIFLLAGRRLHAVHPAEGSLATVTPGALHALGACSAELDGVEPLWTAELSEQQAAALRGGWRLYLATVLVGLSEAASTETRAFCMDRVTFGRKVAHHQAVAFLLADMEIAVDAARLMVADAALSLDDGDASSCHAAFVQAIECALFATDLGVQLHGSHGYVEDYPVEKWMREARALALLAGGVDGARADLAAAMDRRLREAEA